MAATRFEKATSIPSVHKPTQKKRRQQGRHLCKQLSTTSSAAIKASTSLAPLPSSFLITFCRAEQNDEALVSTKERRSPFPTPLCPAAGATLSLNMPATKGHSSILPAWLACTAHLFCLCFSCRMLFRHQLNIALGLQHTQMSIIILSCTCQKAPRKTRCRCLLPLCASRTCLYYMRNRAHPPLLLTGPTSPVHT